MRPGFLNRARSAVAVASPARSSSTICFEREAMREHQRLGAAVERASAVGLGATATAVRVRHGASGGGWIGSVTFRIPRHARQAGPPVRYFGLRASRSGIGLSEGAFCPCPAGCQTNARVGESVLAEIPAGGAD